MVKGVIFDLDGTLIDTIEGLANSVNAAMEHYGFPKHSIEEYRCFVGNGVGKLVERALPEDKKQLKNEARVYFEKDYAGTMLDILPVYPNIEKLLMYLKKNGIKMCVNTNKMDVYAHPMVKRAFGDIFDYILGEVNHFGRKPSPDGVNYLIERMGIKKEECIYIGDSQVDIETARNASIRCISVTWGFRERAVLMESGAEILIDDAADIIDLIERENSNAG